MLTLRLVLFLVAGFWTLPSLSQSVKAHVPNSPARVVVPARPETLQPLDCVAFQRAANVPWAKAVCERTNYDVINGYAKHYGMPQASAEIISIPAHGTDDAKRYGVACMQGLAMKRLSNGWDQLRDKSGNYMRCRDL